MDDITVGNLIFLAVSYAGVMHNAQRIETICDKDYAKYSIKN